MLELADEGLFVPLTVTLEISETLNSTYVMQTIGAQPVLYVPMTSTINISGTMKSEGSATNYGLIDIRGQLLVAGTMTNTTAHGEWCWFYPEWGTREGSRCSRNIMIN